jgi:hypothetical protein
MIYEYFCEAGHLTEIKLSLEHYKPVAVCLECGRRATRFFGNAFFIVPEHMKSISDYNKDNGANREYISKRMQINPSGRGKIYPGKGYDKDKVK